MAIDFDVLFERIGRIGKIAHLTHQHQAALPAAYEALLDLYPDNHDWPASLAMMKTQLAEAASSLLPNLTQTARNTLLGMVQADVPTIRTLSEALLELRRQMLAASETIKSTTVAATATAFTGPTNTGNGVVVLSVLRGDGLAQEHLLGEKARLTCVGDSNTGGASTGRESFRFQGLPAGDLWRVNLGGSGASATTQVIDSASDGGLNLVSHGNFREWSNTTIMPRNWTLTVGTVATDLICEFDLANVYTGGRAAKFATSAMLTNMYQELTIAAFRPSTSYAVNVMMRRLGSVSAGVVKVDLVDGNSTVTKDDQNVHNEYSVSYSSLTTDYISFPAVFRTPKILPSGLRLRIHVTTAIAGGSILVDHVALGRMAVPYIGGPSLAVFSGSTPFLAGDGWVVETTNNYGGSTHGATMQLLMNRLFDTKGQGVLYPTNASPTQPDSLITA